MLRKSIAVSVMAVLAVAAHPNPSSNETKFVDPTAKSRADLANKAIQELQDLVKKGKTPDNWQSSILKWHERSFHSLLASGEKKEERIKIGETLLRGLKSAEGSIVKLHTMGEMNKIDLYEWNYTVLECESVLARIKAE